MKLNPQRAKVPSQPKVKPTLGNRARKAAHCALTGAVSRAQTFVTGRRNAQTGAVTCAQAARIGAVFPETQAAAFRIILISDWMISCMTLSQKVREGKKGRGNGF